MATIYEDIQRQENKSIKDWDEFFQRLGAGMYSYPRQTDDLSPERAAYNISTNQSEKPSGMEPLIPSLKTYGEEPSMKRLSGRDMETINKSIQNSMEITPTESIKRTPLWGKDNLGRKDVYGSFTTTDMLPRDALDKEGLKQTGSITVGGKTRYLYEPTKKTVEGDLDLSRRMEDAIKEIGFDPSEYNPAEEADKDIKNNIAALFQQVTGGKTSLSQLSQSELARWDKVRNQYYNDRLNYHRGIQANATNRLKRIYDVAKYEESRMDKRRQMAESIKEKRSAAEQTKIDRWTKAYFDSIDKLQTAYDKSREAGSATPMSDEEYAKRKATIDTRYRDILGESMPGSKQATITGRKPLDVKVYMR